MRQQAPLPLPPGWHGEQYLHGLCVLDENGTQLSIELEEDLPLASPVQVTDGQGFDMQCLAPLQLHLQQDMEAQSGRGTGARRAAPTQSQASSPILDSGSLLTRPGSVSQGYFVHPEL